MNLNLLASRSTINGQPQTTLQEAGAQNAVPDNHQLLSSPANKWGSLQRLGLRC